MSMREWDDQAIDEDVDVYVAPEPEPLPPQRPARGPGTLAELMGLDLDKMLKLSDLTEMPDGKRVRVCTNCCRIEAQIRVHRPEWRPNTVKTWKVGNRRYYGATCIGCGELERRARAAAAEKETKAAEVAAQAPQTGMRPRLSWKANP